MALISLMKGPYTGVYRKYETNHSIGVVALEGYTLTWTVHEYAVRDTTAFGRSLIEGIYLGADWDVGFVAQEYLRGAREAAWPWGTRGNTNNVTTAFSIRMGRAGRRSTDNAGSLVLTAVTYGGVALADPATLTANYAILKGGSSMTFGPTLRRLPLRLALVPYDRGTNEDDGNPEHIWYTTT